MRLAPATPPPSAVKGRAWLALARVVACHSPGTPGEQRIQSLYKLVLKQHVALPWAQLGALRAQASPRIALSKVPLFCFHSLTGVNNELALRHVPEVEPRWDEVAGPPGRRGDQVGLISLQQLLPAAGPGQVSPQIWR